MFTETEIKDCNGSVSQSVNVGNFAATSMEVQSSVGNRKTQKLTAYNKSIRSKVNTSTFPALLGVSLNCILCNRCSGNPRQSTLKLN